MHIWRTLTDRSLTILCILIATALLLLEVPFAHVFAATEILNRSDKMSDPTVSAVATHRFSFKLQNTSVPVGSISFEFCSNSPLPNTSCIAPNGLDLSNVTLSSQAGETGFAISPSSTQSRLVLTRPAALPVGVQATYVIDGVINPSDLGTFYIRLQTYTSTDGTGSDIENAGLALSTSQPFTVQTEVPPYLAFCSAVTIVGEDCSSATSYLIDLGEFSSNTTKSASSQFVVQTNAGSGYIVTLSGTTLTSGNNIISSIAAPTESKVGQGQFGLNLKANSDPAMGAEPSGFGLGQISPNYGIVNKYMFSNGDVIASALSPDYEKYTVTYIANVAKGQAPGYYATTISLICLANF